ncbi:MAG: hypothetical protein JNK71_04850 [Methyloversatilis sp.]|nr:hypothetical protein [Methyloversatilis sp.]
MTQVYRAMRALMSAVLVLLWGIPAQAATLHVGPGLSLRSPSEAARVAQAGDVVLIEPGLYAGDTAVWTQKRLRIASAGGPVVLEAAGRHAEGKAIWVMRGGEFEVEGIEFRGARVPHGNGAGIRFESGRLVIRNCVFRDNENGILTSNDRQAELYVVDSEFADAPRDSRALHHLLYAGSIAELKVSGSRFHNGYNGHLLKSRAARSDLRFNLLVDGPTGKASYEAEFPNGGHVVMIGNVIGESAASGNAHLVSYGIEGAVWPENALLVSHNTFFSKAKTRTEGAFVRLADRNRFPAPIALHLINNLNVLPGQALQGEATETSGNVFVVAGALGDIDALDFGLASGSALRGAVGPAPTVGTTALAPAFEFVLPRGTRPLPLPGKWVPGAFQTPSGR